ncbi:hypothetical protein F5Y18DRAFT_428689 [Xylariaceae sp. FL1019]|nr:hypothetical protein F5Y18DRAFT_428689 [Xylariaceae sp. FL1019]
MSSSKQPKGKELSTAEESNAQKIGDLKKQLAEAEKANGILEGLKAFSLPEIKDYDEALSQLRAEKEFHDDWVEKAGKRRSERIAAYDKFKAITDPDEFEAHRDAVSQKLRAEKALKEDERAKEKKERAQEKEEKAGREEKERKEKAKAKAKREAEIAREVMKRGPFFPSGRK